MEAQRLQGGAGGPHHQGHPAVQQGVPRRAGLRRVLWGRGGRPRGRRRRRHAAVGVSAQLELGQGGEQAVPVLEASEGQLIKC